MQIPRDIRSTYQEHNITAHHHHTDIPLTQITHPSNPSYQHPIPNPSVSRAPPPLLKQPTTISPRPAAILTSHTATALVSEATTPYNYTSPLSRARSRFGKGLGVRKSVLRVRLCLSWLDLSVARLRAGLRDGDRVGVGGACRREGGGGRWSKGGSHIDLRGVWTCWFEGTVSVRGEGGWVGMGI